MADNQLYFKTKDNIHIDLSYYLGYNTTILIIDSCRGTGKSFQANNLSYSSYKRSIKEALDDAVENWKKLRCSTIFLKRRIIDITTTYILSLRDEINKFKPDNEKIDFYFRDGDRKEGIVDIYTTQEDLKAKTNVFIRIMALGISSDRIKNSKLPRVKYVIFDEYKVDVRDPRNKYLNNEWFKFQEFYGTYERCAPEGLRILFLGNAYSDYSPYQEALGINPNEIKLGCLIRGKKGKFTYLYTKYKPTQELMDKLIGDDPDILNDRYERFAILGEAINDENILRYDHLPRNFVLRNVFKINGKYIGIYKYKGEGGTDKDVEFMMYAQVIEWNPEYKRVAYVFELDDLSNGSIIPSKTLMGYLSPIKLAMNFRQIAFQDIALYYNLQYAYSFIPDR